MHADEPLKPSFLATPRGRRLAAAVLVAATAALVTGVVVGVGFDVRAALPPPGPGPRNLSAFDSVDSLAVSANSERAAAAGKVDGRLGGESSIRVWDVKSGRPTRAREYQPRHPSASIAAQQVGLSPDGLVLAAMTCELEPLRWWLTFFRVETGELVAEAQLNGPPFSPLTFTADGSAVVFVTAEGIVTVRAADRKTSAAHPVDKPGSGAVYVPALGRVLQVRHTLNREACWLATWDPTAADPPTVVRLAWSGGDFDSFAVPRDGRTVVVLNAARDRTRDQTDVTAYDRISGQRVSFVRLEGAGGTSPLTEIALSADGRVVAIEDVHRGGLKRSVDVYQVADGVRVAQSLGETFPGGGGMYARLTTIVPDGSALYFVRRSSTIVRLDLKTGEETED